MRYLLPAIALLLPLQLFTANPSQPATVDEAKAAAEKWLAGLGEKGLIIEAKPENKGFAGQEISGSESTMFVLHQDGWYINLGFSGVIEADTPLATVRQRFKYIALDRVPTPGLSAPGWEIRPRTPVSSFKEGVEITSYEKGRITFQVKTNFFALSGRDTSVQVPTDAGLPPTAYFQIRQNIPFELRMDAPFAMGE